MRCPGDQRSREIVFEINCNLRWLFFWFSFLVLGSGSLSQFFLAYEIHNISDSAMVPPRALVSVCGEVMLWVFWAESQ